MDIPKWMLLAALALVLTVHVEGRAIGDGGRQCHQRSKVHAQTRVFEEKRRRPFSLNEAPPRQGSECA